MVVRRINPRSGKEQLHLISCSCVSREWRAITLPHLFQRLSYALSPSLKRPGSSYLYISREGKRRRQRHLVTLDEICTFFQENTSLAACVKHLKLCVPFDNSCYIRDTEFLAIAPLFPSLQVLHLSDVYIAPTLSTAPPAKDLVSLKTLHVCTEIGGIPDEAMSVLLGHFADIGHVYLHANYLALFRMGVMYAGPPHLKIRNLTMFGVPTGEFKAVLFHHIIVSPSAQSLQTISIDQIDGHTVADHIQGLLVATRANLRSLTLSFDDVLILGK